MSRRSFITLLGAASADGMPVIGWLHPRTNQIRVIP